MSRWPARLSLWLFLSAWFSGCPCAAPIVNASPELRWFLFSRFGADQICPEMLKTGFPLRLAERAPSLGRFFPAECTHSVDGASQTVTVHFSGTGYAYVAPAKRIGFSCSGSVEYRPDFQIAGDRIYVWGKLSRILRGPEFRIGAIENVLIDMATQSPAGLLANAVGNQLVAGEITRGFTVVHSDQGNEFSLGVITPPSLPHHPFDVEDSDKFTYMNESIDVYANQRDFLGPIEFPGGELEITIRTDPQPLDLMIVHRATGDTWRHSYQTDRSLGPPPGPVIAGAPVAAGTESKRSYTLSPGAYYVVLDNTASAGLVAPQIPLFGMLGDPVTRTKILVQRE